MLKAELIASLSKEFGMTRSHTTQLVNSFVSTIIKGVKRDGEANISGFGKFKVNTRKARESIHPQNSSIKIHIPAINVVTFKAGADFKKAIR